MLPSGENRHNNFVLERLSFKVEKGEVIGIAGGVGSGKSALISSILGQLSLDDGDVIVRGDIAYVPQVPWIINASLRDNIIFGNPWDQNRYEHVLESCCLCKDLKTLSAGDSTEIGERGINLSGGQKQRVSLGRAVYSDRDIYLLDDPFSSVDPDIAEKLFEQVILNDLVGKTVLLVTNNVQFLSRCDQILFLQQGRIAEKGTHEDLIDKQTGLYAEYAHSLDVKEDTFISRERAFSEAESDLGLVQGNDTRMKSISSSHATLRQLSQSPASSQLVKEEEAEGGAVTMATYWSYIKSAGGLVALLVILLLFLTTEGIRAFSYWWLAYWISQGSGNYNSTDSENITSRLIPNMSENPQLGFYNLVYASSLVALLLALCLKGVIYSKVVMHASSNLHQKLLSTVTKLPMRFFDTTPVGRIINRFSKDMDELDSRLPPVMDQTVQCMLAIITYLILIGVVIHWFLIAVPPFAAVFVFLYMVFRRGSRDLQRLQNISVSPLLSHISTTVSGLPSIHAYDKTKEFYDRFIQLQDHNSVMLLLFNLSQRWINLRLSLVTTMVVCLTTLFIVLLPNHVMPAYAGLAIVYASQLSTLFQFFVRMAVDTETKFVSVERINNYIQQPGDETQIEKPVTTPGPWPHKGHICFVDYSAYYREGQPLVLKNINLEIKSGEKIGIVGRTGSGKSSLASAIFHLLEASSGRIEIDSIDISHLSLVDLRSKLSIIPQDPVLFKGTVRSNLDPIKRNIDHEIWRALEKCHIKEMVNSLADKLDAPVSENGENFSFGERQLLCMARVLLRHSKIVVLDEATASIDAETDSLIQVSLREAFADCTMLIIAHRLSTVIDLDRVIIIDNGKIIETGTPAELMDNKDSRFNRLMALGTDTRSSSLTENIPDDAWV